MTLMFTRIIISHAQDLTTPHHPGGEGSLVAVAERPSVVVLAQRVGKRYMQFLLCHASSRLTSSTGTQPYGSAVLVDSKSSYWLPSYLSHSLR